jgi:hypothetical protein
MSAERKPKWGARPKAVEAIVNPEAADAFVAGGSEQPAPQVAEKPAEKVKLKRLTIDIDPPLHKRLKARATEEDTTIADVARKLLQEWAYR